MERQGHRRPAGSIARRDVLRGAAGVALTAPFIRPARAEKTVHVPELRTTSAEEREAIRRSIVEKLGTNEVIENLFPELYRCPSGGLTAPRAGANSQIENA